MRWLILPVSLLAAAAVFLSAQTAAPNASGVSAGHVHFMVKDDVAMRKLLVDVLGGKEVSAGTLRMVKFPNAFAIVSKAPGELKGGSDGSTLHHVGFYVKSFADVKAKAAAAGVPLQELTPGIQGFLMFPDDIRVEVQEDASVTTDAAHFNHFHLQVADRAAELEWYQKMFGGPTTERRKGNPGMGLTNTFVDFLAAGGGGKGKAPAAPPAGTQGRSGDHIGFEVTDLKATIARMEAAGAKFDRPYTDLKAKANVDLKIAFLTDPAGTYIELTEGLNKF